MKSHEVLRDAITGSTGVKEVAGALSVSTSLVYKWCEPAEGPDPAGTDNPLDRVAAICRATGRLEPLHWLCERFDGMYVTNPPAGSAPAPDLLLVTRRILREFTDLLDVITRSTDNDGRIDRAEADRIRTEWEQLKRIAEQFVRSCEAAGPGRPAVRKNP